MGFILLEFLCSFLTDLRQVEQRATTMLHSEYQSRIEIRWMWTQDGKIVSEKVTGDTSRTK